MGNSTPLAKIHDSPAQESQETHWDDRGDRTESHLCRINSNINWITFLKSLWKWKSTNNNKGGERLRHSQYISFPFPWPESLSSTWGIYLQCWRDIQIGNSGLSSSLSSLRHSPYQVKQKRPGPSVHHSPFPEALFLTSSFLADSSSLSHLNFLISKQSHSGSD